MCSVAQLRDGGRHVVATPQSTGGIKRPYPLRPDSISLVTYGKGWVLSVPSQLVQQAKELSLGKSFSDIAEEGDRLLAEWFANLGKPPETVRPDEEGSTQRLRVYTPLARLAKPLRIRGWSHYFHWYCDPSSWNEKPLDKHVHPIREDDPQLWEQWLTWHGPFCEQSFSGDWEVSDAFGYVLDGKLVSVAQLQTSSKEFAWEFGVDTLPEFRCRGFATEVSRAATAFVLKRDQIPWYYYDHYNRASSRIPQKLGYFLYMEGLFSHHG